EWSSHANHEAFLASEDNFLFRRECRRVKNLEECGVKGTPVPDLGHLKCQLAIRADCQRSSFAFVLERPLCDRQIVGRKTHGFMVGGGTFAIKMTQPGINRFAIWTNRKWN